MATANVVRVRYAPWGRKKFLAPLPILSLLLVAAAVAAPTLLRTTFTFFQDGHLTISASVQNVVHASGPTGKILGVMTVTNAYAFDVSIASASALITSGTVSGTTFTPDASPLVVTVPLKTPLVVPAGSSVTQSFSGSFTGSVLALTTSSSFLIHATVVWSEIHSTTQTVGPFTYDATKACPTPFSLTSSPDPHYWTDACFTPL